MAKVLKYGLMFLGFLLGFQHLTLGQEEGRLKSLEELRQLGRGHVAIDEKERFIFQELPELPEVPEVAVFPFGKYYGTTNFKISKELDELSLSKKFTFNVEDKYTYLSLTLVGELKEGSLKIILFKPDHQLLKEIKFVPNQNQTWFQTYSLEDVDGQGFNGKWTVELSCSQASGYYQFVSSSR